MRRRRVDPTSAVGRPRRPRGQEPLRRHMKMIQIRNVPDELHRSLKARAAREGRTLSDLILSDLPRLVSSAEATTERAGEAIADLLDLPIERYAHDILVPRVWQLRDNFSAHDASYVALAEALADKPVPLLTADARLARAVAGHADVPVILAA